MATGKLAIGLAAVTGMLGSVIIMLITFAIAAVVARERFVVLLART